MAVQVSAIFIIRYILGGDWGIVEADSDSRWGGREDLRLTGISHRTFVVENPGGGDVNLKHFKSAFRFQDDLDS